MAGTDALFHRGANFGLQGGRVERTAPVHTERGQPLAHILAPGQNGKEAEQEVQHGEELNVLTGLLAPHRPHGVRNGGRHVGTGESAQRPQPVLLLDRAQLLDVRLGQTGEGGPAQTAHELSVCAQDPATPSGTAPFHSGPAIR